MVETESEATCTAVLTPPLSLEGGLAAELRPANLVQRLLSLFRNVRPGSDLSHFQVSHRPPVSALHATDEGGNVELVWCQHPVPKFYGTSIEATVKGKRQLKLPKFNETYEVECPNLLIRLLPAPSVEWSGAVRVVCKSTGLEAELSYCRSRSFLGIGGDPRCVKGRILRSGSGDALYEIEGHWDRTVSLKDVKTGKVSVLYDAQRAIANLRTPVVEDQKGLSPSESAVVWGEVSEAILSKDWEKARQAKRQVEDTARRLAKERNERGEVWMPKHFSLSQDKNGERECCPLVESVPAAPVVVPS